MKRKICTITGTRAEYGLLFWLMKAIQTDPDLQLQIIATGSHLSPEFGMTYKEIEKDFTIHAKVEMLLSSDSNIGITKSLGLEIISICEAFDLLKPDIIVILGDRYEILGAVASALLLKIPVAHIHGGELTYGVIDDQIRHAVTKMSNLHFTATEQYRKRIIQMGENPDTVFNVGAMALDNIANLKLLTKKEFSEQTGFNFAKTNFLVTFHPVQRENLSISEQTNELLKALDNFPDANIIFTQPNADAGGREISAIISQYTKNNPHRCMFFNSLGQLKYLSAMKHIDVLIGNSSSGIIEMPYFKKPTVNIGSRQDGRIKPDSVIDCKVNANSITDAINLACSEKFLASLKNLKNPYGKTGASVKIKDKLKTIDLNSIAKKKFYDINFKINAQRS